MALTIPFTPRLAAPMILLSDAYFKTGTSPHRFYICLAQYFRLSLGHHQRVDLMLLDVRSENVAVSHCGGFLLAPTLRTVQITRELLNLRRGYPASTPPPPRSARVSGTLLTAGLKAQGLPGDDNISRLRPLPSSLLLPRKPRLLRVAGE